MVNQMLYMTLIINWQHVGKCEIWFCCQIDICNDEMETLGKDGTEVSRSVYGFIKHLQKPLCCIIMIVYASVHCHHALGFYCQYCKIAFWDKGSITQMPRVFHIHEV